MRLFVQMRQGRFDDSELEKHLNARGFMMRFFGPLARSIDAPWKMYPLGVLFGLGFDTATEVAFLVLAGTVGGRRAAASGRSSACRSSSPPGMSLLDTIDGSFMNFAYGWAFSKPVRKVYYNIAITGLSVFVAFYIGTLELLQVLAGQLHLHGGLWNYAAGLQHQRRRLHHRGDLRRRLGLRPALLALRPGRRALGARRPARPAGPRRATRPPLGRASRSARCTRPFTIDES